MTHKDDKSLHHILGYFKAQFGCSRHLKYINDYFRIPTVFGSIRINLNRMHQNVKERSSHKKFNDFSIPNVPPSCIIIKFPRFITRFLRCYLGGNGEIPQLYNLNIYSSKTLQNILIIDFNKFLKHNVQNFFTY